MAQSIVLFMMKIGNAGLAFLLNLLVARIMGVDGFGDYSMAMSLIAIFSVVSTLGLETLAIKEVAIADGHSDEEGVSDINNSSLFVVTLVSIFLSSVFFLMLMTLHYFSSDVSFGLWSILAITLIFPLATINRHISFLQMAKQDVFSQFPLLVITPLTTILLLLLSYSLWGGMKIGWVLTFFALSNLLVVIVYLRKAKYSWVVIRLRKVVEWVSKAKYFFLLNVSQVVIANIGLVMLWLMGDSSDTGLFSAAVKISSIVLFLLYSTNMVLMPAIADCYHNNKRDILQKKLINMNRLSFIAALMMFLGVVEFGRAILGLFGSQFEAAFLPLITLIAGMLFCAIANAAGPMLSMTGHVKKVAILCSWMMVLSLSANFLLIPSLKATGAALATSLTLIVQNVVAVWLIYKHVGINPTLFGKIR